MLASQEIHDISVAIGVDPGSDDISRICVMAKFVSWPMRIRMVHISQHYYAHCFYKHFRPLVEAGHVYVAMPPLFRIDHGKEVYYALDEAEKQGVLDRIAAENKENKINVIRFKGLGEMNPMQLRETTMDPDTRRLMQIDD